MVPMTPFNVGVSINKLEAPDLNIENISKSFSHLTDVLSGDYTRNKELERKTKEAQLQQIEMLNTQMEINRENQKNDDFLKEFSVLARSGYTAEDLTRKAVERGVPTHLVDVALANAKISQQEADERKSLMNASLKGTSNSNEVQKLIQLISGSQQQTNIPTQQVTGNVTQGISLPNSTAQDSATQGTPSTTSAEPLMLDLTNDLDISKIDSRVTLPTDDGNSRKIMIAEPNSKTIFGVDPRDLGSNYINRHKNQLGNIVVGNVEALNALKLNGYSVSDRDIFNSPINSKEDKIKFSITESNKHRDAFIKTTGRDPHKEAVIAKVNTATSSLGPFNSNTGTTLGYLGALISHNSVLNSKQGIDTIDNGLNQLLENKDFITQLQQSIDPLVTERIHELKSFDKKSVQKFYADNVLDFERAVLDAYKSVYTDFDPKDANATKVIAGLSKQLIGARIALEHSHRDKQVDINNRDDVLNKVTSVEYSERYLKDKLDHIGNINQTTYIQDDFASLLKPYAGKDTARGGSKISDYELKFLHMALTTDTYEEASEPLGFLGLADRVTKQGYKLAKDLVDSLGISSKKDIPNRIKELKAKINEAMLKRDKRSSPVSGIPSSKAQSEFDETTKPIYKMLDILERYSKEKDYN